MKPAPGPGPSDFIKVTRRGLGASNENVSFKLVEFGFGVRIW